MVEKEVAKRKDLPQSPDKIGLRNKFFQEIISCARVADLIRVDEEIDLSNIFFPHIVLQDKIGTTNSLTKAVFNGIGIKDNRLPIIFIKRNESKIVENTVSVEGDFEFSGSNAFSTNIIQSLNIRFNNFYPELKEASILLKQVSKLDKHAFRREGSSLSDGKILYLGDVSPTVENVLVVSGAEYGFIKVTSAFLSKDLMSVVGEDGKLIEEQPEEVKSAIGEEGKSTYSNPEMEKVVRLISEIPELAKKQVELKTPITAVVDSKERSEDPKLKLLNEVIRGIESGAHKDGLIRVDENIKHSDIIVLKVSIEPSMGAEHVMNAVGLTSFSAIFINKGGREIGEKAMEFTTDMTLNTFESDSGKYRYDLKANLRKMFRDASESSPIKLTYASGNNPSRFVTEHGEKINLGVSQDGKKESVALFALAPGADSFVYSGSADLSKGWQSVFGEDGKLIPETGEKQIESKPAIATVVDSKEQAKSPAEVWDEFVNNINSKAIEQKWINPGQKVDPKNLLLPNASLVYGSSTEKALRELGLPEKGFPIILIENKAHKAQGNIISIAEQRGFFGEVATLKLSLNDLFPNEHVHTIRLDHKEKSSPSTFYESTSPKEIILGSMMPNGVRALLITETRNSRRYGTVDFDVSSVVLPEGLEGLVKDGRLIDRPKGQEEKEKDVKTPAVLTPEIQEINSLIDKIDKMKNKPIEAFQEISEKVKTFADYSGPADKEKGTKEAGFGEVGKNTHVEIVPSERKIIFDISGLNIGELKTWERDDILSEFAKCFHPTQVSKNGLILEISLDGNNQLKVSGKIVEYVINGKVEIGSLPDKNISDTFAYFFSQLKPLEKKSEYFSNWIPQDNGNSSRREARQSERPRYDPSDRPYRYWLAPETTVEENKAAKIPVKVKKGANRTGKKARLIPQNKFLIDKTKTSKFSRK